MPFNSKRTIHSEIDDDLWYLADRILDSLVCYHGGKAIRSVLREQDRNFLGEQLQSVRDERRGSTARSLFHKDIDAIVQREQDRADGIKPKRSKRRGHASN